MVTARLTGTVKFGKPPYAYDSSYKLMRYLLILPERYDLADGTSNMPGRPINLVIRNSTNFTMQGMRFVQSQFWTMAVHTAQNVLLEDITISSVSNSSVCT